MADKRVSFMTIVLGVVGLTALLWTSKLVACELAPNQQDFRWELAEDAFPQPSGMLLIAYEDAASHQATHVTYHRVVRVFPKPAITPGSVASDQTMVEVDGSLGGPLVYVILSAPLYYGTDLDELGLPRRMWFDPEEDGLNGNEMLMDSPAT
jgi:hypothetical protein